MESSTTILRRLLDERGVEYHELNGKEKDSMEPFTRFYIEKETQVIIETASHTDDVLLMMRCTPEQAVAATLGTKRDRTEEWLLNACNQASADYIAELEHKLEAATLDGWKLTADDVRDLIERHSEESGGNRRDFRNGAYEAIADELNAMLGGGECESSKERLQKMLDEMKKLARDGQREWCGRSHGEFDIFATLEDFADTTERRIDRPWMWR